MTISTLSKFAIAFTLALAFSGLDSIQADEAKGKARAFAKGKEGREGKRPGARGARGERAAKGRAMMFRDLDLTEDQKAQLKKLMEEARAKREGNKDGSLRKAMKAAREAGDKEKMKEIIEQAREKHKTAREAFMKKLEAILTPEQLEKLKKKREDMKAKHGNRDGKRRGFGPRGKRGGGKDSANPVD